MKLSINISVKGLNVYCEARTYGQAAARAIAELRQLQAKAIDNNMPSAAAQIESLIWRVGAMSLKAAFRGGVKRVVVDPFLDPKMFVSFIRFAD
jgi:hypothetical protein